MSLEHSSSSGGDDGDAPESKRQRTGEPPQPYIALEDEDIENLTRIIRPGPYSSSPFVSQYSPHPLPSTSRQPQATSGHAAGLSSSGTFDLTLQQQEPPGTSLAGPSHRPARQEWKELDEDDVTQIIELARTSLPSAEFKTKLKDIFMKFSENGRIENFYATVNEEDNTLIREAFERNNIPLDISTPTAPPRSGAVRSIQSPPIPSRSVQKHKITFNLKDMGMEIRGIQIPSAGIM